MKKKYICPEIEITELMSESLMQTISIDNTGNGGADGEKQTVTDSNNPDINVGSKDNNDMWGNSYNVWE
jgi:hypothetical protein